MLNAECRSAFAAALSAFCLLHSAFAGFRPALPGYEFAFPRDHGSHDEYKTEWWYYTGHLTTDEGQRYGFELTFFRVGVEWSGGLQPADGGLKAAAPQTNWELRNLSLAHFAISDIAAKDFRFYEKLNRSSPFTANAAADKLDVFNEGWRAVTLADGSWRLVAASGNDSIDLVLTSRKPPAVNGENGVSIKAQGAGYASHYYSMTRLEARGSINGHRCRGLAWMDHEFGSSALRENQQGWDWFSIQLDNDTELMLYQIRRTDGTPDVTSSGSLVTSDGDVIHLRRDDIRITPTGTWQSPHTRATYPMGWKVAVPKFGIALVLQPLLRDQELVTKGSTRVTYWEGAVDVTGSAGNTAARGSGYVEMTGYDRAFRAP